jgi:hypothetical protein
MKFAQYDNPKHEVAKKRADGGRTLVVVCAYIPEGLVAGYNSREFITHEYTWYQHNRLEALKFTIACYDYFNAGADYDLVIVDNDSPDGRWYLDKTDKTVLKRENSYYSFGAYKHAWDVLGKDYDYFVFTEMDWAPSKNDWLKDLIKYWNSDEEIGMIGNLIEQHGYADKSSTDTQSFINNVLVKVNPDRKNQYNLDSEYLFVDRHVLENMEKNGGWNIFDCEPKTDLSPVYNELGFQQPILEMGYKLACYNDGEHTMFYAIYNRGFPDKWKHGFNKMAPFVPEQTRLFVPEMKKYFNWYAGKTSLHE